MTNARSLVNTRLSMLAAPRALSTRAEFVADIRREWTNALESTVQVGRRLNEAKAALPHGEYEAMVQADLPFGASTARKLREVAEFVDAGTVPLDQLPEAYSTLYAIATLPDEVRAEAVAQGVIRPDVTRAEVEAFKEAKAPPRAVPPPDGGVDGDLFAPESPPAAVPPPPAPTVIEVEPEVVSAPAVVPPVNQLAAAVPAFLSSPYAAALRLPWHTDPTDPGAIVVNLDGQRRVLFVMVALDAAAADLVRHVIDTHNATVA